MADTADRTEFDFVENYQTSAAGMKVKDRTLHKLLAVDGVRATGECGAEFHAELHAFYDAEDLNLDKRRDKHLCGRCFPDGGDSA